MRNFTREMIQAMGIDQGPFLSNIRERGFIEGPASANPYTSVTTHNFTNPDTGRRVVIRASEQGFSISTDDPQIIGLLESARSGSAPAIRPDSRPARRPAVRPSRPTMDLSMRPSPEGRAPIRPGDMGRAVLDSPQYREELVLIATDQEFSDKANRFVRRKPPLSMDDRQRAIEALVRLGDGRRLSLLVFDRNRTIRNAAIAGLERLGEAVILRRCLQRLEGMMSDIGRAEGEMLGRSVRRAGDALSRAETERLMQAAREAAKGRQGQQPRDLPRPEPLTDREARKAIGTMDEMRRIAMARKGVREPDIGRETAMIEHAISRIRASLRRMER